MPALTSLDRPAHDGLRVAGVLRLHDVYDAVLLLSAAVILVIFTADLAEERPEIWDVTALLALNGTVALIGFAICLRSRYPILLACFFFDYIFLALAPLQQIRVKFDPIYGNDHALYMALMLALSFTAIGYGAIYFRGRPLRPAAPSFFSRSSHNSSGFHPVVLFCAVIAISCGLLAFYGGTLFSSRQALAENVLEHMDKTTSLFLTTYLNPLALLGAVAGILCAYHARKWRWFFAFFLLLFLAGIVDNPIVTARFRSSAMMSFALLALTGWNNTRALSFFLVAGMIASPISNMFRYENVTWNDTRSFDTFFVHMDYDAFTMLAHVVFYVGREGFSYGDNILAAILFFVPRALWSDKSEHVAHYVWPQVRYYRNVWTDNLSSPPFAEGFYAFGVVGALLLTAAVFTAYVILERRAQAAEQHSPSQFIVCLAPMLTIIMLRGPFIVGYSEFVGNIVALLTVLGLLRIKLRVRTVSSAPPPDRMET